MTTNKSTIITNSTPGQRIMVDGIGERIICNSYADKFNKIVDGKNRLHVFAWERHWYLDSENADDVIVKSHNPVDPTTVPENVKEAQTNPEMESPNPLYDLRWRLLGEKILPDFKDLKFDELIEFCSDNFNIDSIKDALYRAISVTMLQGDLRSANSVLFGKQNERKIKKAAAWIVVEQAQIQAQENPSLESTQALMAAFEVYNSFCK